MPNAILPDGSLLPFPIPLEETKSCDKYGDLVVNGRNLYDIISELKPKTKLSSATYCHLDPDLRRDIKQRNEGWLPAFGQADQSLSELRNAGFDIGDLLLFFGWFRETEINNGKLRYKKGAPNIHLIYGYLQVAKILTNKNIIPDWLREHPHAESLIKGSTKDAIFLPAERLSFLPDLPGASLLKYSQDLVLTAPGMSRSRWSLPDSFKGIHIGHSPKQPQNGAYYQSPTIGQEMVWETTSEALEWIKSICRNVDLRH